MFVTKDIEIEAAHNLLAYRGKCEHLHGHRWKIQVTVKQPVGPNGLAFDFTELGGVLRERIFERVDHRYLNEILPQPSAENLAIWVWAQLKDLPLHEVKVWETATSFVTYHGDEPEMKGPTPAEPKLWQRNGT